MPYNQTKLLFLCLLFQLLFFFLFFVFSPFLIFTLYVSSLFSLFLFFKLIISSLFFLSFVQDFNRPIKQLGIKLGSFTLEGLDSVFKKFKNRKAAGLDEIPPEVWKTRQLYDLLLRHCNAVYN